MGAWVAQSVKRRTLDFGSGHDLRAMRSSPVFGSALGIGHAKILSLPLPLSAPAPHCPRLCTLSLKKKVVQFILFYVAIQFPQYNLLKILSFSHWISFLALLKINLPYSCGFIPGFLFCSIDL